MVSRLRPLELNVDFEDRAYKLGEPIDIAVEMVPRADVDVREGRVDLVCEERYTESYTVALPAGRESGAGLPGVGGPRAADLSKKVINERKESHVHSSVMFVSDSRLVAGRPAKYETRLNIQERPPPQVEAAIADANTTYDVKWRLVTSVNVARGRDPKKQQTVEVLLD
jgi:hypothetical protein